MRDVEASAQQWRFGGAPNDVNHTRIIDLAWPEPGVQEKALGTYAPATAADGLGPGDFANVPLVLIK